MLELGRWLSKAEEVREALPLLSVRGLRATGALTKFAQAPQRAGIDMPRSIRPSHVDLEPYVLDFKKSHAVVDSADYSLWERDGWVGWGWHRHYFDERYSFILAANFENPLPVAVASFSLSPFRRDAILIGQLQSLPKETSDDKLRSIGIEGYHRLSALKWERMLVRIIEDWAAKAGFAEMHIIRGERHGYYSTEETGIVTPELEARNKRIIQRYDLTAKLCGYSMSAGRPYSWKALAPG